MSRPTLSVLIDTYNHERYIEQAIVSVLEQDFPASDMEIVVVDDGSADRTPEIVRKFAPRVRLLRKKNGGQASAFNAAIPELHGEIVALLDGDDWFANGKLTAALTALEQDSNSSAVGHAYYEFHEATQEKRLRAPTKAKFLHLATPEAAREARLGWPFLLMGALTVRRKILERVIPIPEALVFCGDAPIIMSAMAGGTRVLAQPLSYYRHHSDNLQAVDHKNAIKMRRRSEMAETMFRVLEPLLIRLGVPSESIVELLYPGWTAESRLRLRAYGGSRLDTFHTEMRAFRLELKNSSLRYRMFKYLLVGPAGLLLPPRRFYQARDWYAQRNLSRFRELLCKRVGMP